MSDGIETKMSATHILALRILLLCRVLFAVIQAYDAVLISSVPARR